MNDGSVINPYDLDNLISVILFLTNFKSNHNFNIKNYFKFQINRLIYQHDNEQTPCNKFLALK